MFKNLLSLLLVVVAVNACNNPRPKPNPKVEGRSGTSEDIDLVLSADTPEVYEVGYKLTDFVSTLVCNCTSFCCNFQLDKSVIEKKGSIHSRSLCKFSNYLPEGIVV